MIPLAILYLGVPTAGISSQREPLNIILSFFSAARRLAAGAWRCLDTGPRGLLLPRSICGCYCGGKIGASYLPDVGAGDPR